MTKETNFYELSHNAWKYGNEKINYWIIAPGTNAVKWPEYSINGEIGIGWDDLGDLSNYKILPVFHRNNNQMLLFPSQ